MAAKYPDVLEDASPDSGDSMFLKSNEQALSAKEILKNYGFCQDEVEQIASAYGTEVYQAAETAKKFSKLGLAKGLILDHLMSGRKTGQRAVQSLITSAVSEEDDVMNMPSASNEGNNDSQSAGQSGNENVDSHPLTSQQSGSSSITRADSSFPDLSEFDDLVDEEDMPLELKEGQFDIFLLFLEEDNINALKFLHFLETELKMRVCYTGENFVGKRNQFDSLEEAIKRSLYTFIFVTEKLLGDSWLKYKHDAALAESINTNGEFVIPVRAENCKIPFSLQPLTALRIYHIIDAIPDHPMFLDPKQSGQPVDENAVKQIPFVKNQIVKLVGAKERLKKRRLQMDEEKKQKWKEDEKIRKYQERVQNELESEERSRKQALLVQDIEKGAKLARQNFEQEAEMRKEMEINYSQQGPILGNNNLAATMAMLQMQMQNAFGRMYPGFNPALFAPVQLQYPYAPGGIHYHLPSGSNPADVAPRPTINLQVEQLQNMQLGDQNQMVQEAADPVSQMCQAPSTVPQPPVQNIHVPSQGISQTAPNEPTARDINFPIPELGDERNIELGSAEVPRTTLEEHRQQTVLKWTPPPTAFTPHVQNQPTDPAFSRQTSENESILSSEWANSNIEEGRPPEQLQSPSIHNYGSAPEHLHHSPGEQFAGNHPVQLQDPVQLIGAPPEQLDDAVSIRSLQHPQAIS